MILYILSACPIFTLGYKTLFESNFGRIVVFSFDSLEKLKIHNTPKPGIILVKALQSNFETEAKDIKKRYTEARLLVAVDPKHLVRVNTRSAMVDLYFPVDEPLELTLSKLLTMNFGLQPQEQNKIYVLSPNTEIIKTKYSILPGKLANCLFFISQDMNAEEISIKLHRSQRTVEGYFSKLEKHFGVSKKSDLIAIFKRIEKLDQHFEVRQFRNEFNYLLEAAVG